MEPQPTWWDAFRVMWHKLLDDVVACGAYTSAEADVLRDLLDQHREDLDRPVVSRLLHMDVWGQNILVDAEGGADIPVAVALGPAGKSTNAATPIFTILLE